MQALQSLSQLLSSAFVMWKEPHVVCKWMGMDVSSKTIYKTKQQAQFSL